MKCPNCNAEIKEGSIICPVCNTQFAFTGSDNYINLPDDDLIIKSTDVEEYVDPYEGKEKPINVTPGSLNLKTNKAPKKVIKRVVKVTSKQPEEEAVVISPSVNFDKNDEASVKEDNNLETTVVNVGGFTNTIVDATSAIKEEPQPSTPSVVTSNMPPVDAPTNSSIFAPTTQQAPGVQLVQNVDMNTNTIGVVSNNAEPDDGKPKKKISETMMISFIMGLILILLCLIIFILLQNSKNPNNVPTTTTMTTFNCEENDCNTTTTTTTVVTTTKPVNLGVKTSLDEPGTFGFKSLCTLSDSNNNEVLVDITLDKLLNEQEASEFMKNYDNKTYREGMAVGVLQYTITGNELEDGQSVKPITSVAFYNELREKKFSLNGGDYYIGFFGISNEQLTNKNSVTVTGYFNYPINQLPTYICIGNIDGTQACYKIK